MKKLLPLFLALVLALCVLASCQLPELPPPEDDGTGTINPGEKPGETPGEKPGENPGENPAPEEDEDLKAAYDYIKLTYKTLSVTSASFEVIKNAPIGDKMFAITWTTSNAAITITESEDGSFYVVNVPEPGATAVNYTLSFSVQNEAGEKKEGSFNLTIPKYNVNTFEEYVNAEDGEALVIQGIVTGVMSKGAGTSTKENSLFLQDLSGNGGYYAYNLAEDPNGVIKVGMTVEVSGNKKNYNGTFELTNPVAKIIDSTIKTVTPVDFTETLASAAGLDADELVKKNGMLVTIKGVTLLEYSESNGYHYFKLGDHKTYLRVSSSSNCISRDDCETLTETFVANFQSLADVTGLIAVFNGDFYLMPVSVNAFTNFVEQEATAEDKVDSTLANTTIPGMIQLAGDTKLPTAFSGFSDVTISWELVSGACASVNNNTLSVTIPDAAEQVVLKATASCGDFSKTKEYTITVKPISTITIEEANNIGMLMTHNTYTEELYYIIGTVESIVDGQYGNLYLEDGDFSIYVYGTYDATGKIRYDAMNPQPLPKDIVKVLSSVGKYSNDVQLKNVKVVEHTVHEDNQNASTPDVEFVPVAPIVNTEFFFGMTKNDVVYYITGAMATGNASYYMASTAKQADTVKITVLAGPTADTYYITLTVGGATKYMDIVVSGTHKNAVYVDAAPAVGFSFDSEFKVFYKELDGSNYTFGTALSNTFTTIGGVKVDAANAMLQISFAEAHVCDFTDVVTAPDCENEGYTTHTCACGNVVVDSKVPALTHDWDAEGNCKREGCDATNHEHDYEAEVTAPTCTAAGYTTYSCKVEGCTKSYVEEGAPALDHADEDGDLDCDNQDCDALVLPEDGATITIAQALKIGAATTTTQKYYVSGMITGFYSSGGKTYGNVYITDGTDTILVYGLYKDGKRYDAMDVKPVEYDTIQVYGVLSSYQGTAQFKDAELIEHEVHACSEYTEATCKKLAACVVCGTETGDFADHSFADGVCTACGALDHVHSYTAVVTAPTCTQKGYTTYTCSCNDSYIADEVDPLDHVDEDGDLNCDNQDCDALVLPEDGATITIAQALKIGALQAHSSYTAQKYYVTGVITAMDNDYYGNVYISDGTNMVYVYGLYKDGAKYGELAEKPVVYDTVTIYGAVGAYYETVQFKNADIVSYVAHVCSEYTEATCEKLAACVVCGAKTGELAEHTMVNGVCSVCGHEEGAAEVVTATATLAYTTATTTNMTGNNDAATLGLDATIFSVIGNKGGTNNNCGLNKSGQIRLYGNKDNGNGSYFTVTTAEGYTIKSIKITFGASNNKNCQLTVDGVSTVFDASSSIWEVDDIDSNSFKLQNVITGNTTQIYILSIEITYVVPAV